MLFFVQVSFAVIIPTLVILPVQGSHRDPPQSTPVSSPFFIPSSQVAHGAQLPPQSTPVSSPSLIPLKQESPDLKQFPALELTFCQYLVLSQSLN